MALILYLLTKNLYSVKVKINLQLAIYIFSGILNGLVRYFFIGFLIMVNSKIAEILFYKFGTFRFGNAKFCFAVSAKTSDGVLSSFQKTRKNNVFPTCLVGLKLLQFVFDRDCFRYKFQSHWECNMPYYNDRTTKC